MDQVDEPIRGHIRNKGFRRVSHGLFLKDLPSRSDAEEFLRELYAWLAVLPAGAVFTHLTAARLLGWRLPPQPERVPVFAAVHHGYRRPRRLGLLCSRLVGSGGFERKRLSPDGLPVDEPEEILLRAARDLGHLDLVVLIDSARALGHLRREQMTTILNSGRPGTRALRAAYLASDPRAESAGESLLRRFHDVMDVSVVPQAPLSDRDGACFGRADLLITGTRQVHEYDGAGHRSGRQHRSDLRRDRRLTSASYTRRGFTLDDLINHPAVTMHELDRALERPHRPSRLELWRQMVTESLYSESGRDRLLNRWRRSMGVDDWV